MQRIQKIDPNSAEADTAKLLSDVRSSLGMVPNIFATMGNSQALLGAYLSFSGTLGSSQLPGKLNEQIALAVAGINQCDYCASAHMTLGAMAGVDADELAQNLRGTSHDPKTRTVLSFAAEIVTEQGRVSDQSLVAMRDAGFSDGEILEVFGQVMANIITNYFNHLAGTEVDFPAVSTRAVAAA